MSYTKTHDPRQIIISALGIDWIGPADGVFASIDPPADGFKTEVGAQGDVVRLLSADNRHMLEITLQAASPTNDLADAYYDADRAGDTTLDRSVQIKDLNGTSVFSSDSGWLMNKPKTEHGTEGGTRVWKIECASADNKIRGKNDL